MDAKVLDLITRFFPVSAVTLSTLFSRFIARTYARKELKENKENKT
jgi:hypothetical protein